MPHWGRGHTKSFHLPSGTRFQYRRPPRKRHRSLNNFFRYVCRRIGRGKSERLHRLPAHWHDHPCCYTRLCRSKLPRCRGSSGDRRRTKVPQPSSPFFVVSGGIQRWTSAWLGHTRLRQKRSGTVRGGNGDRHRRGCPPSWYPRTVDLILWFTGNLTFRFSLVPIIFCFWGKCRLWALRCEIGCGVGVTHSPVDTRGSVGSSFGNKKPGWVGSGEGWIPRKNCRRKLATRVDGGEGGRVGWGRGRFVGTRTLGNPDPVQDTRCKFCYPV